MSQVIGDTATGRCSMPQPISKARLVITALFVDNQTPAEVAARYGVHRAWVYKLKARYEAEGDAALEPRSRRPKTSPTATPDRDLVDLIVRIRKELADAGLDAGPDTIAWHLNHHHGHRVSRATISRHPDPRRAWSPPNRRNARKSSYLRFQAAMPNETWQSDFTHYRLTCPDGRPGADVEIISWLDDCTRYALHDHRPHPVTGPIVRRHLPRNRSATRHPCLHPDRQRHGLHRPARRRDSGGRNALEHRTTPPGT